MSQKTVVAKLDSVLLPLGFSRQGFTWNRRRASAVDVIDAQLSKAGDAVTINAGVLDSEVHLTVWGSAPPEEVEQPMCTVGARVGELIDGRDKWWQLSNESTPDDVAGSVSSLVLPFLDKVATRQGMQRWLTDFGVVRKRYPPPIINLAVIKSLLGESEEACALLAQLADKASETWRMRIAGVANRLSCR